MAHKWNYGRDGVRFGPCSGAELKSGTARVNYFCPKCKKSRPVEIQAVG